MNRISIKQAWAYATGFFNGQTLNHAIALIGMGIIVPTLLRFVLPGIAGTGVFDPTSFVRGGASGLAAMSGMLILIGLICYILQAGSYFASWRIGFAGDREPLVAALGYGLVAALPALLLIIAFTLILGVLMLFLFGGAMASMIMGGGTPSESSLFGAGLMAMLAVPFMLFFMIWLATRFCCIGPVMADRANYNILIGLGESWRLTAASQWKIFAYFLLLGIAFFVFIAVVGAVVGLSLIAGGGLMSSSSIIGLLIGGLVVGIPLAYVQVAIPAGIYRALGQGGISEVFA